MAAPEQQRAGAVGAAITVLSITTQGRVIIDQIIDRIAFGGVKELEDLYAVARFESSPTTGGDGYDQRSIPHRTIATT